MIASATEFIKLRTSDRKEDYDRAAHEEAPLEVWWQLVREHPEMKTWVVHNKTVPLEILDALSTDEEPAIREAVARKRKASFEIFERLARDSEGNVRYAVACNAKAPLEILRRMLDDDSELVVERVKKRFSGGEGEDR